MEYLGLSRGFLANRPPDFPLLEVILSTISLIACRQHWRQCHGVLALVFSIWVNTKKWPVSYQTKPHFTMHGGINNPREQLSGRGKQIITFITLEILWKRIHEKRGGKNNFESNHEVYWCFRWQIKARII